MIITKSSKGPVSQKFGQNFNNFYAQLKLKGHDGIDIAAVSGSDCRHNVNFRCTVFQAENHPTYGNKLVVIGKDPATNRVYKFYHGHLKDFCAKVGDYVDMGDLLGHTDNTGIYTTGPHEHFGMYECADNNLTMNKDNGYGGALDPAKYGFKDMYVLDYLSNLEKQVNIYQRLIILYKLLRGK
jgi:murein DD-endopeptidase MepM/ murein hydrolase activator NlpD